MSDDDGLEELISEEMLWDRIPEVEGEERASTYYELSARIYATTIIAKGILWSTKPSPQINLVTKTIDGSGEGPFISKIEGLSPSTIYFIRAYATNLSGTAYGDEISFTSAQGLYKIGAGVSDIDGNNYKTIIIGSQEWMSENLKTSRYNNGDSIPNIKDDLTWLNLTTGAFSYYGNDFSNNETYGKLYNFYTIVDSRGVCPTGWHVPTSNNNISALTNFLGSNPGGKLKQTGNIYWGTPNVGATNQSGFSALPGGYRWPNTIYSTAPFGYMGQVASFWSYAPTYSPLDITAPVLSLDQLNTQASIGFHGLNWGHSIRCIKN